MLETDLLYAVKNINKELIAIEKDYKKKNIIHRLKEDQGYNFYKGKLFAFKYVLDRLGHKLA
jgi:hypothetical protein